MNRRTSRIRHRRGTLAAELVWAYPSGHVAVKLGGRAKTYNQDHIQRAILIEKIAGGA
jgi:hypothetical protein